jgi:hypothetical protein
MAFAEKVTLHACEVTTEDIAAMRGHGFTDDEISDIVVTAASRCMISKVYDSRGGQPLWSGWTRSRQTSARTSFRICR